MTLAPILLFTYNRPWHLQQTINTLAKNEYAIESDLIIYSDAHKNEQSRKKVESIRQYIKTIRGFKSITVVEREKNMGLANNIIEGVTAVVNKYGRVIVLEDDLESSPYMLKYFNEALSYYENEEKVMHIGAYMFPIDAGGLPETFFFRLASSWGWATWKRAWQYFNPDIEMLHKQFDAEKIHAFSMEHTENFWKIFQSFRANKNSSWAIRWYASMFLRGGLALHPATSMVNNIGIDGSGIHSGASGMYKVTLATQAVTEFPSTVEENKIAYERIKYFFRHRKGNLFQRGIRFLRTKYKRILLGSTL
ncbi:MAG: glycosyltransferase [Prevotellaceae bacterium]|jgi:GT2 family glycosyltransferase|nr:glycosyltransferase [Prevotellaceae bacterium]